MQAAPEEEVITVGSCRILPASRRLFAAGRPVPIGGRAFDLLMALVDRHHRVVAREELYDLVWPGVAVEPNNLHVQIWMLRRIIGASALKTVPRRGYRLVAPVERRHRPMPAAERAPALAADEPTGRVLRALDQSRWVTVIGGDPADRGRALEGAIAAWRQRRGGVVWHVTGRANELPSRLARLADATRRATLVVLAEPDAEAVRAVRLWFGRLARAGDVRVVASAAAALCDIAAEMLVPVSPPTRKAAPGRRSAAREGAAHALRWRARTG
jgi:DNA-binding winged helix-turn-helix (wHTH) protein